MRKYTCLKAKNIIFINIRNYRRMSSKTVSSQTVFLNIFSRYMLNHIRRCIFLQCHSNIKSCEYCLSLNVAIALRIIRHFIVWSVTIHANAILQIYPGVSLLPSFMTLEGAMKHRNQSCNHSFWYKLEKKQNILNSSKYYLS